MRWCCAAARGPNSWGECGLTPHERRRGRARADGLEQAAWSTLDLQDLGACICCHLLLRACKACRVPARYPEHQEVLHVGWRLRRSPLLLGAQGVDPAGWLSRHTAHLCPGSCKQAVHTTRQAAHLRRGCAPTPPRPTLQTQHGGPSPLLEPLRSISSCNAERRTTHIIRGGRSVCFCTCGVSASYQERSWALGTARLL